MEINRLDESQVLEDEPSSSRSQKRKLKRKVRRSRSLMTKCLSQFTSCMNIGDKKDSQIACDLVMYTLTCNKLSHCLYDFDCADFQNEYKNERYEFNRFRMNDLRSGDGNIDRSAEFNKDLALNQTDFDCK